MARKKSRKSRKSSRSKSRRKSSKRTTRKAARRGKGKIPLPILEKRARKLVKLVRHRGGSV